MENRERSSIFDSEDKKDRDIKKEMVENRERSSIFDSADKKTERQIRK